MVRLKHRYLLINILYPAPKGTSTSSASIANLPDVVQFRQPTSDQLTPQLLVHAIRSHVSHLFGDYGMGAVGSSLSGASVHIHIQSSDLFLSTNAALVLHCEST